LHGDWFAYLVCFEQCALVGPSLVAVVFLTILF
jgi:hypothetical protein